jgi:hypothetical protein
MMSNVAARGAGNLRPASKNEEAALRKLESAREANFGATRIAALDAETTARVDELFAQMAIKSLRIAALAKRELSKTETEELSVLQGAMSDLPPSSIACVPRRRPRRQLRKGPFRSWRANCAA